MKPVMNPGDRLEFSGLKARGGNCYLLVKFNGKSFWHKTDTSAELERFVVRYVGRYGQKISIEPQNWTMARNGLARFDLGIYCDVLTGTIFTLAKELV
jgi:hypothetical protein